MITHKPVGRIKLTLQDRDLNRSFVTFYFDWDMDAQSILSAYSSLIAAIGALSDAVLTRVVVYYDFETDNVAVAGDVGEVLNVFVQSEAEIISVIPIPSPKQEIVEEIGPYRFIRLREESKSLFETLLQSVPFTNSMATPIGTIVLTGGMAE